MSSEIHSDVFCLYWCNLHYVMSSATYRDVVYYLK